MVHSSAIAMIGWIMRILDNAVALVFGFVILPMEILIYDSAWWNNKKRGEKNSHTRTTAYSGKRVFLAPEIGANHRLELTMTRNHKNR